MGPSGPIDTCLAPYVLKDYDYDEVTVTNTIGPHKNWPQKVQCSRFCGGRNCHFRWSRKGRDGSRISSSK